MSGFMQEGILEEHIEMQKQQGAGPRRDSGDKGTSCSSNGGGGGALDSLGSQLGGGR